jgi:hypothetical protein
MTKSASPLSESALKARFAALDESQRSGILQQAIGAAGDRPLGQMEMLVLSEAAEIPSSPSDFSASTGDDAARRRAVYYLTKLADPPFAPEQSSSTPDVLKMNPDQRRAYLYGQMLKK